MPGIPTLDWGEKQKKLSFALLEDEQGQIYARHCPFDGWDMQIRNLLLKEGEWYQKHAEKNKILHTTYTIHYPGSQ